MVIPFPCSTKTTPIKLMPYDPGAATVPSSARSGLSGPAEQRLDTSPSIFCNFTWLYIIQSLLPQTAPVI